MHLHELEVAMWAMCDYIYNTNGDGFVADVFVDPHPTYAKEKRDDWNKSPLRAINKLDFHHLQRLFSAAWLKCGERCRKSWLKEPAF